MTKGYTEQELYDLCRCGGRGWFIRRKIPNDYGGDPYHLARCRCSNMSPGEVDRAYEEFLDKHGLLQRVSVTMESVWREEQDRLP